MPCRQAAHVWSQAARHALLRTSNHGRDGGPRRAELLRAQGSLLFGLQLRFVVLKSHTLSRVSTEMTSAERSCTELATRVVWCKHCKPWMKPWTLEAVRMQASQVEISRANWGKSEDAVKPVTK